MPTQQYVELQEVEISIPTKLTCEDGEHAQEATTYVLKTPTDKTDIDWGLISAVLSFVLIFFYLMHFFVSLFIAGTLGLIGFTLVFYDSSTYGLLFFIDWLVPLMLFCKFVAFVFIIYGVAKPPKTYQWLKRVNISFLLSIPQYLFLIL